MNYFGLRGRRFKSYFEVLNVIKDLIDKHYVTVDGADRIFNSILNWDGGSQLVGREKDLYNAILHGCSHLSRSWFR